MLFLGIRENNYMVWSSARKVPRVVCYYLFVLLRHELIVPSDDCNEIRRKIRVLQKTPGYKVRPSLISQYTKLMGMTSRSHIG